MIAIFHDILRNYHKDYVDDITVKSKMVLDHLDDLKKCP